MGQNTSGRKDGRVPEEIDGKWNWSAFLFAPIFAGINRLWIWLGACAAVAAVALIPGIPPIVASGGGLGIAVTLARHGNALAWRARRWESVEQFKRTQRRTAWLSFVATVGVVIAAVASLDTNGRPSASTGPTTYRAHGISFIYPAGWEFDRGGTLLTGAESIRANAFWIDALFPDEGDGLIAIFAFDFGREVTRDQLERHREEFATDVAGSSGDPSPASQVVDVGGLPALLIESSVTPPSGGTQEQRLYFVVSGSTWIAVKCQHSGSDTTTLAACDSIVRSFALTDAAAAVSPSPTPTG